MTMRIIGRCGWSASVDDLGYRTYKLKTLVGGNPTDGPAQALNTPGLPAPGSRWLVDNDVDIWAWCRWEATATPKVMDEPGNFFEVENTFSTRPFLKCNEIIETSPLLKPQVISGSFSKYTEEFAFDRFGKLICNSAFEQLRGPQVEFDRSRPSVRIEQNVASLGLEVFGAMVDTVNAFPLWGLPPRMIKLTNVSWEQKFHSSCNFYYTRTFEFDINYYTFDRNLLDEGSKVLFGHWDGATGNWEIDNINGRPANPFNPTHFMRYVDRAGNPGRVVLDGGGLPAGAVLTQKTGLLYMSMTDNHLPNDLYYNIARGDSKREPFLANRWRRLVNSPLDFVVPVFNISNIPFWEPQSDLFPPGSLRKYPGDNSVPASGDIYLQTNLRGTPGFAGDQDDPLDQELIHNEPGANPDWLKVTPNDRGVYRGSGGGVSYKKGDYVTVEISGVRGPGYIHVERYGESDFSLLGIPLVLTH